MEIYEYGPIMWSYLKNMQTHTTHCAVSVKPVTTNPSKFRRWSISGNYIQFNKTPNSMKYKIGEWNAYPDVKILNINYRERVTNMHIQQPMNQFSSKLLLFIKSPNSQYEDMNPNFPFSQVMRSLQFSTRKRVYNIHTKKKNPLYISRQNTYTHENSQIPYEHMNPKFNGLFTNQLCLCNWRVQIIWTTCIHKNPRTISDHNTQNHENLQTCIVQNFSF